MSFSLKWGDESPENAGFIYFDAVTNWQQNYSGKVTSHPVDGGGNISDHFIRDNPKFTLSGVISSIDLSVNSWLIADPVDQSTPLNVRVAPASVNVQSTDLSVLNRFIPNSLGQFIPDNLPSVESDSSRDAGQQIVESVKDALIRLIYSGKTYNETTKQFDSIVNTVTIYEYGGQNGTSIVRAWPEFPTEKLVVTNVVFREDVNTGQGLYCDITFEQVEFVSLQKVEIPKRVVSSLNKKAAGKKNVCKCDSSVKDTTDPNNADPQAKKNTIQDLDPQRTTVQEINQ
jgi:hypothetical protein